MPIDMEQVKAALDPEEPDYAKAAKQLGADALPTTTGRCNASRNRLCRSVVQTCD